MNLQGKKVINYMTNFLILGAVFLSMVNANSINAQSNPIANEKKPSLEILQGEFIHEFIGINETLSFTLDIKDPHEGNAYNWKVLVPPKFGEAQVTPIGDSVEVTYQIMHASTVEDDFSVQVKASTGESALTHIFVQIDPENLKHEIPNPELPRVKGSDRERPGTRAFEHPGNPNYDSIQYRKIFDQPKLENLKTNEQVERDLPIWFNDYQRLSEVDEYRETPYFKVFIDPEYPFHYVDCYGWTPNETATLKIDDPSFGDDNDYQYSSILDSSGNTSFEIGSFLDDGFVLTISDGTNTKDHTIIDLSIISFDIENDKLFGSANPGMLMVNSNGVELFPTANALGDWTADFSGLVDLTFDSIVIMEQSDNDNDITQIWTYGDYYDVNPYMQVYPIGDYIYSYDWVPETQITLSINGNEITTRESRSWGDADFWVEPFDITAGQEIVMSDGTYTITHIVPPLTVTDFDEIGDTVSGTAESGSTIRVTASGVLREVVADQTGLWVADYSGSVDIVPGTDGYARQSDEEGNSTNISWYVPDPYMQVYPEDNYITSYDWAPNTPVTLTIDDIEIATQESTYWGFVNFSTYPETIVEYQEIVMSDGNYTITYIVTPLTVTGFDETEDIVSGTAEPGSTISVSANSETLEVTADTGGFWIADFSGVIDIVSGTSGYARQFDVEGNSTNIYWFVPDPYMQVYPLDDYAYGERWTPNATITLSIGETQWTKLSDQVGWVSFNMDPFDILPGQELVMTDGTYTRTHLVTSLTVTGFDIDADSVSGTANAATEVYLEAWDDYDWESLSVITDSTGNWTAFFSNLDVTSGAGGYALQYDNQGNSTNIYWYVPDPYMRVYPLDDNAYGEQWTPNTTVTLNIGGSQWTSESDGDGWVSFNIEPFDILPGQEIVMTDGIYTRSHLVKNLAITSVDEENNIITGTAAPGSMVIVTADDAYNWESMEIFADTSGLWIADFTGMIDFGSGTSGYARQYDNEDNSTNIYWFIPDPRFQVYLVNDYIYGSQWTPNSTVTASIDGIVKGSGKFDENGWGYIDINEEFVTGQVVSLTDGTYTRTHTVLDLAVTNVDTASDIVTGRAEPGSELKRVSTFYEDDWYYLYPITDGSGVWHANFSGIADIIGGSYGWAVQADENENETVFRWFAPNPTIRVYPRYGEVYGIQWPSEADVTLTIGSQSWTEKADVYNGSVYFYPEINLTPGLTLQMTDGVTTRTHTIINLAVTDFDTEADTLSGTADPGELTVYTCDTHDCYYRYPSADGGGNWTADFSGLADIAPSSNGWMYQEDTDGNETRMYWALPNPRIEAHPNADTIYAYEWTPNTDISLSIDNVFIETKESSTSGYAFFVLETHDLQPGQVVKVTDGTYTKTHTVINLAVTEHDETLESLSGTANPGELQIIAYNENYEILYPEADSGSAWSVQLNSVDVAPGVHADLEQLDEDGDYTVIYWLIPDPSITAYLSDNFIVARDWPQNTDITLNIDSARETWTGKTSESGYVHFELDPYILQPGDSIEMTDGTTSQTHIVQDLIVVEIDNNTDILRGTGGPEGELIVCAYDYTNNYYESECLTINADTTGNWEANFAGLIDIRPGVEGSVRQYDENENYTYIYWSVSTGSPIITGQKELSTPEENELDITLDDLYVTDPDNNYPDDFTLIVMSGTNYTFTGNTITPIKDFNGILEVPVKVNDGTYNSNTFNLSISVTPVNDSPVIGNIPDQNINEGETFSTISLNDYVTDVDHADAEITWSTSGETELVVSIDAENVATIVIPSGDWSGSEVITFTATDPELASDSDTATFSVNAADNNPPVITEDDPQAVTMSEDGSPTPFNLTLNASDDDGDTLTWGISSQATNGTATASGTGNSMTIGYTPNQDYNGSDSFIVQVLDGNGGVDTITINVTIEAVNDPPVITGQAKTLSIKQDEPLLITLADLIVEDVDDTYPNGFILTVLSGDNYTVDGNTITPTADFSGTLEVSIKVSDGKLDSNEFMLSVTVAESNEIFLPLILR